MNHADDSKALHISLLAENVYQHVSQKFIKGYGLVAASGLIVIDGVDAYIIDTPWSIEGTKMLIMWIKNQGFTLKGSISTHFHEDASGGIPYLNNQQIPTYVNRLTNTLLKSKGRELASHIFKGKEESVVSGIIDIYYPGAGHSQDNIVVWLPRSKILFGGCFVKNLNSKSLGYTGDASLNEWSHSVDNVIVKYPTVNVVVPGHGDIGGINLLQHTKSLVLLAQ